jgi:hypothetical protein
MNTPSKTPAASERTSTRKDESLGIILSRDMPRLKMNPADPGLAAPCGAAPLRRCKRVLAVIERQAAWSERRLSARRRLFPERARKARQGHSRSVARPEWSASHVGF